MKKIINLTEIQKLNKQQQLQITGSLGRPHDPCSGFASQNNYSNGYCRNQ